MDHTNLYTNKDNFLVILDSRNATTYNNSSWNSSIVFNLETIVIPQNAIKMYCSLLQFTCPNSIYNINQYNSILSIFLLYLLVSFHLCILSLLILMLFLFPLI